VKESPLVDVMKVTQSPLVDVMKAKESPLVDVMKAKESPLVDVMKAKESPLVGAIAPPQNVEGEDWIVLQPKASLMKKLFKQKFPAKFCAIGIQGGLVLG
jgi:hypothetical protein